MDTNEYSPLKIIHHIDKLKRKQPVMCQLDLTNICNYNCIFCTNKNKPNLEPNAELSFDMAKSILDQLSVLAIVGLEFTGGGEPLEYPYFRFIVEYGTNLGFQLGLITNGGKLGQFADILSHFCWIRVSIDASTEDTYYNIKKTKMPDLSIISQLKSVTTGASFIVVKENVHEMYSFALMAKQLGFDNCRFSYNHDLEDGNSYYEPIKSEIMSQLNEAESIEGLKVFSLKDRLNIWQPKTYDYCYYSDLAIIITADAKVYNCCEWKDDSNGCLGDLHNNSLKSLLLNRPPINVKKCPPCWMDSKNILASYAMLDNPKHINFP